MKAYIVLGPDEWSKNSVLGVFSSLRGAKKAVKVELKADPDLVVADFYIEVQKVQP